MKKVTITTENINKTERYISKQGVMYESNPDYKGYRVSGTLDSESGAVVVHIEKPTFKESVFDLMKIQDKEKMNEVLKQYEIKEGDSESAKRLKRYAIKRYCDKINRWK